MYRVRYSRLAVHDLTEIADYLEREADQRVARLVLQRIRLKLRSLERDAHRYRERNELGNGRRAVLIGAYIAFYRIDGSTVYVLRILHGARQYMPHMFDN